MKNYCPDLFQNLYIQKNNANQVELGFCCVSRLSPPVNKIDFNDDYLETQRQKYLLTESLPESCSPCVQAELSSTTSRRLQRLQYTIHNFSTNNNLKFLQYNCDNICNLKCIACSSACSSSWIDDEIKLGIRKYKNIKPTKNNNLLFDFKLEGIQDIYFNGGEPLLTKDHINVLNYIVEKIDPCNIHINYNTNATLIPNNEVIRLWEKFASVTLIASIDALESQFEYIRYPGKWKAVHDNLKEYKKFSIVKIGANIGVHNIMYFNELYDYALENEILFNFQSDTIGYLSLKNLPIHLKPAVISHISKAKESSTKNILLNTLNTNHNCNLSWVKYLKNLDRIRNTNWKDSLSELYKLDPSFFDKT
jgi:molybdenum cofactor biosynthesis enzyme MoaA